MYLAVLSVSFLLVSIPLAWAIYTYLRDPLQLRKYPAPGHGIAGLTNLWSAYQIYRLRRYKKVDEAHRILGPVIRIQPNHLSFNIPEAASQIYGHGSSLIKDDFYEIFRSAQGQENIVGVRDKGEHARKRKMISSAFAPNNIVKMQPAIDGALKDLIDEFDALAVHNDKGLRSELIDLTRWINFLTFDIIATIGYGESMGFVKQKGDIAPAESRDSKRHYQTSAIDSFHIVSQFESILGLWPQYLPKSRRALWWCKPQRNGTAFIDMCIRKLRNRLKRGPPAEYKDLFGHYLTDRNGRELGLEFEELVTESNVILNAGSDTTATATTNLLYLLFKDKDALSRLRAELDDALDENVVIPEYSQVKELPYLTACIEEGLRHKPPLLLGLPRKTTCVTEIAGHVVQRGVTVSVPCWSLHHHESILDDPLAFRPERWLDEENAKLLKKFITPFSQGPRACIGRNLAYVEIFVVIAALVKRFDITMPRSDFELPALDRHVTNPGFFPVSITYRQK